VFLLAGLVFAGLYFIFKVERTVVGRGL
jgi:hypothetical protein